MVTSLILAERIETTLPKAKELRRLADHMITLGKEGTLHARRQAARIIRNPDALKKLFDGLAARFTDRQGGYTRVYKFGYRRGDAAEMAAIEYLGYQLPAPAEKGKKEEAKRKEPKKAPKPPKKEAKSEKRPEKKEAKPVKKADKKGKWGLFGWKKGK